MYQDKKEFVVVANFVSLCSSMTVPFVRTSFRKVTLSHKLSLGKAFKYIIPEGSGK